MNSSSNESAEKVPDGVLGSNAGRAYSSDYVSGLAAIPAAGRTFDVTPHHEQLPGGGVRFAVEDVSPASMEDKQKHVIPPSALRVRRLSEAKAFYQADADTALQIPGYEPKFAPMRLEAASTAPEGLVYVGSDAFIMACLTSFARHLPLALKPDHIWGMITHGFAKHVDQNAEALREKFVQHKGKKRLRVSVNHFTMSGGIEGTGTPAELWERDVFPDFSRQICEHVGKPAHSAITGSFSTTDSVSQAAHEIVLMSAMKNYFSYGMRTCCGIPQISLLGSREDWVQLRARAEHLGSLMLPDFTEKWLSVLLPVLDQFVAAYDGQVNHGFWQSMVKLRHTGGGSGSHSFISGWIQLFYPYLASGNINQSMRSWQEMYFSGPEVDQFPTISSSAPVDWEYFGVTHDLHFHAGFAGMVQDPANGELMPVLGWHVTYDPPQDTSCRLAQVQEEIASLAAGHVGEEEKALWFQRITVLRLEEDKLNAVLQVTTRQAQMRSLEEKAWRGNGPEQAAARLELASMQEVQSQQVRALELA